MSGWDPKDLEDIRRVATIRADIARSDVAAVRGAIGKLEAEVATLLNQYADADAEPSLGDVHEKWLQWRASRVAELNSEIATARAHLARVAATASRAIAQEEAIKLLWSDAVAEARREKQRRAVEANATSLGGRYR